MSVTLARAEPSVAGVGDYIELMKPRVMSLVVARMAGRMAGDCSRRCGAISRRKHERR
jgi:heme O synthase-like polyprenyltransferase